MAHNRASYFRSLLNQYINGQLDEEGTRELFVFFENHPEEADQLLHEDRFIDKVWESSKQHEPDEASGRRMQERLQNAMYNDPAIAPVRPMERGRLAWGAAASVILILSCWAIYSLLQSHPPKKILATMEHLQNDVAPGGSKAVLTLADGSEVILDSIQNGNIATQGNASVVKLSNGQLVYNTAVNTLAGADEVLLNTMKTPRGGQYTIKLPDGTDVWLNSASSITYPTSFAGKERMVSISGEVYFEVAHNAAMPFKVKINPNTTVEVLGTHFNINAYEDEEFVGTTLLEGSVRVTSKGSLQTLQPGQQAQIKMNGNIRLVRNANLEEVMAWKNGLFCFDRADLKTVMRQIARWYDVEVVYDGTIPADKFVGKLPMDANASQVLSALSNIGVKFQIEGKKITIRH